MGLCTSNRCHCSLILCEMIRWFNILTVVDDDDELVELIAAGLSAAGFTPLVRRSAADAYEEVGRRDDYYGPGEPAIVLRLERSR